MEVSRTSNLGNKENILAQLRNIIYQGDINAILPFLKKHQQGNISILRETLKQVKRYWEDGKDFPNNLDFNPQHHCSDKYYHRPYNENRSITLSLFAFALLNLSDVNSTWFFIYARLDEIVGQEKLLNILKQIQSKWLTEYLTIQVRNKEMTHLSYATLQILEQHQLIEFNPELIALSIVALSTNQKSAIHETFKEYTTESIIYQRDIPTLFDYETRLFEYWYGTWQEQNFFWQEIFIYLLQENKIDRRLFIQKTLEIQTKDWYSHAKAFFKKILARIEVKDEELLILQDSLFLLLHSEYSATVNFALELIKPLIQHPEFHFEEYLTWLASLMPRNDLKNAIKMILQQMDAVLKQNKKYQESVLSLVTDTFLQNDFSLQERATKILLKHLNLKYELVIDKLKMYQANMMGGIANQFKFYVEDQDKIFTLPSTTQKYMYYRTQPQYLKDKKKVQLPQNWQELLFFISETLQSSDPLDIDILMSAWILLKSQFPKDYQKKLKPIIKQMEKFYGYNANYKMLFKVFFLQMHDNPQKAPEISHFDGRFHSKFMKNYYNLLETFAQFSYEEIAVPLLSLPTHAPSYIDPEVLVQRLLDYQRKEIQFNFVDLAIALCRTPRENIYTAIKLLSQLKHAQLQLLLSFAFGQMKSVSDLNLQEDFKKMSLTEQCMWWGLWDTVIKTHDPQKNSDEYLPYKFKQKYVSFTLSKHEQKSITYIYPALCFNSPNYDTGGVFGLVFFQHITPVNKNFNDLAYAANGCDSDENLYSISEFIHIFSKEDYILNPYSLFILATHSFNSLTETRLVVSEVLASCFNQQKINLEVLAQHYATLIYANYASCSRLFQCLKQVKDSSGLCNQALIDLIFLILKEHKYPEKLPTNFKQLFELYYELIAQYHIQLDQNIKTALQAWQAQFPTLKSSIQKLIKQGA